MEALIILLFSLATVILMISFFRRRSRADDLNLYAGYLPIKEESEDS